MLARDELIARMKEDIHSNHSGDIFGIEEVADYILAKQKNMIYVLDSIMRWGEANGGHWCRESARNVLAKNKETV